MADALDRLNYRELIELAQSEGISAEHLPNIAANPTYELCGRIRTIRAEREQLARPSTWEARRSWAALALSTIATAIAILSFWRSA